jgi:hypothetical protein
MPPTDPGPVRMNREALVVKVLIKVLTILIEIRAAMIGSPKL